MLLSSEAEEVLSVPESAAQLGNSRTPNTWYTRWGKRTFELLLCGALLVLAIPLMLLVLLCFWFGSLLRLCFGSERLSFTLNGRTCLFGAIFLHPRISKEGRAFVLYKITTLGESKSGLHRTVLGRLLRRFRIDELPQLLNVLRGEMNLIGPRPMALDEYRALCKEDRRFESRTSVAGGITGLSQVELGRPCSPAEEYVKLSLDLWYVEHVSLWVDCYIALKTPWVVLSGFGAR